MIWARGRGWQIKYGSRARWRRYGQGQSIGLDPLHPLKLENTYEDELDVGKFGEK